MSEKPSISEMRENPRFVPELNSTWEGWLWPLKCAHKTHVLKIEHPELGVYYLEYVPDFIRLKDNADLDRRLTHTWEFHCIERWLENYPAEFVRCKKCQKMN